ncbi:MAG: SDR family NAD(P)-dependent oxidoreductase [Deltaproteobacteria bacterium]|nr:SDR family NAD(P)-dependent oxidoreductase [Deltaproteobacteria bacterium]
MSARRFDIGSDMQGRTCLVTGATDGHGKAVALALAERGADVVLHGRSREKTLAVRDEVARAAGGKAPEILLADLARPDEIDAAVATYVASGRPLHVLVNNAGLVGLSRRTNEQGLELTFAVNYLAMFRLTLGLLPRLLESAPARIVNVSSDTYRIAKLDLEDLQLERGYSMTKAYAQSKLAIVYFTLELARRLDGARMGGRAEDRADDRAEGRVDGLPGGRVTVNAVDPGPVASNIGADNPGLAYRLIGPLIRGFFPSASRAARTALILATDPALESETGGYYRSRKRRAHPLDFDPELSRALWARSLALCGIAEPRIG